jgi:hypothetical protein
MVRTKLLGKLCHYGRYRISPIERLAQMLKLARFGFAEAAEIDSVFRFVGANKQSHDL